MLRPSSGDLPAYEAEFKAARIGTLCEWLDDLASSFPPHAAPAVRFGLGEWSDWVADPEVGGSRAYLENGGRKLTLAVHGQGRLWRGLLSGEKRPEDLLAAQDYVAAAHRLIGRTASLVGQCLREWIGVIVVALLALVLLLAAVFAFLDGNPEGAATLAAILAGLGLSWKALGATPRQGALEARAAAVAGRARHEHLDRRDQAAGSRRLRPPAGRAACGGRYGASRSARYLTASG